MKFPTRIALSSASVAALALASVLSAPAAQAATNVNYPDPGKPYSTVSVKVGDHTDKLWIKQISTRTLELDGKPTQWKARYEAQVRDGEGRVLVDANLSVYKVNWIYVHFDTAKRYASDASMMQAFAAATVDGTEANARAEFRNIYDSLGKFRTTSGKLENPYTAASYDPAAFSDVAIASGKHEVRVKITPLSTRTLELRGVNRGDRGKYDRARYEVEVRDSSGVSIFDQNYTVYRLDALLRGAPLDRHYASDSALVQALNRASADKEPQARATFKQRYGSLGQFRTTDGKLQNPQVLPEDA